MSLAGEFDGDDLRAADRPADLSAERELAAAVPRSVKPSAYVAAPIDQVDSPSVNATDRSRYLAARRGLVTLLRDAGFAVYAPWLAWQGVNLTEDSCPAVLASNQAARAAASCTVAMLPAGIPTVGTHAEIGAASDDGQPCVVVGHEGGATIPPGVIQVGSIDSAAYTLEAWRDSGVLAPRLRLATDGPAPTPQATELPFLLLDTEDGKQEGWHLPTRHYADDAAFDLWVTSTVTVEPGRFVDVPAGCRVELPVGTFGMIVGRSSSVRKRGLLVVTGIIDYGYRGDLFVGVINYGERTQTINRGERIGQFIVLPNLTEKYRPVPVDRLGEHPRGESGFGSTGGIGGTH